MAWVHSCYTFIELFGDFICLHVPKLLLSGMLPRRPEDFTSVHSYLFLPDRNGLHFPFTCQGRGTVTGTWGRGRTMVEMSKTRSPPSKSLPRNWEQREEGHHHARHLVAVNHISPFQGLAQHCSQVVAGLQSLFHYRNQ